MRLCIHCKDSESEGNEFWNLLGFCTEQCWHDKVDASQREIDRMNAEYQERYQQERIRKDLYSSPQWLALRYRTLRKFGFKCMACDRGPRNGVSIHVDHIKPVSKFPGLALSEDNLQVLCAACNYGKSNSFEDDLRP